MRCRHSRCSCRDSQRSIRRNLTPLHKITGAETASKNDRFSIYSSCAHQRAILVSVYWCSIPVSRPCVGVLALAVVRHTHGKEQAPHSSKNSTHLTWYNAATLFVQWTMNQDRRHAVAMMFILNHARTAYSGVLSKPYSGRFSPRMAFKIACNLPDANRCDIPDSLSVRPIG